MNERLLELRTLEIELGKHISDSIQNLYEKSRLTEYFVSLNKYQRQKRIRAVVNYEVQKALRNIKKQEDLKERLKDTNGKSDHISP